MKYWQCREYIGLGIAAHSYYKGVRYYNTSDLPVYLSGNFHSDGKITLTLEDKIEEFMIMGLRMTAGISRTEFKRRFNISVDPNLKYILDLGYVGETAEVSLNGENIGIKIAPPYRFDISEYVKDGTNELCITVTNHLGFEVRDKFSRFLKFEPSGLIGPVKIEYGAV